MFIAPYPTDNQLQFLFLAEEHRQDLDRYVFPRNTWSIRVLPFIFRQTVERWIETHWSKIFTKYRDKRAAIIKMLRKEVGIMLDACPMPFKGGQEAMAAWRVEVSRSWNIYNVSVRKDGDIKIPQSFKQLAADLLERMEKKFQYEQTPAVFIAFLRKIS